MSVKAQPKVSERDFLCQYGCTDRETDFRDRMIIDFISSLTQIPLCISVVDLYIRIAISLPSGVDIARLEPRLKLLPVGIKRRRFMFSIC